MTEDKKTSTEQQEFEKFRKQVHPEQASGRSVAPSPRGLLAIAFGIFMIIVYIGMGVLFFINFFNFEWTVARYIIGTLLILYGIYRGYRMISYE